MSPLLTLSLLAGSSAPRILPAGVLPRLERAFARSAGEGMLDLLRHGLPVGAAPVLAWLRQRTQERVMLYLRCLRRGDSPAEAAAALAPTPAEAAAWLESMPLPEGSAVQASYLVEWCASLDAALQAGAARENLSVEQWISRLGEGWQQLGMLCFHLAENAGEAAEQAPFAFLATFVHRVGQDGSPRHVPLGMLPRLLAQDHAAQLSLLRPLQQVANESPFWRECIDGGSIYRPCAWSPRRAYEFLETLPLLEAAGIEVRMVNLWKSHPPKAELQVQLSAAGEERKPDHAPALHIHSLLRFSPRVVLGDSTLSEAELEELLAGEDGLVRFRGEWVRLDKEKLRRLLCSWRQASRMAAGGIPLLAGLRWLLARRPPQGLPPLPPEAQEVPPIPADSLRRALENLHLSAGEPHLPEHLAHTLRPYQMDGVRFLLGTTEAGFGACLADDMGLGKTLQVIAWLAHLHAEGALDTGAALIVAPASLLHNWQEELARFAPQLNCILLHPDALRREEVHLLQTHPAWLLRRAHVALTTYGMATRCAPLLVGTELPALVLDEAQAIKNPGSRRTQALVQLASPRRVALTGTPVENSLTDVHSLFRFLSPGLLGSEADFRAMVQRMGTDYSPLRRLIRPFMLRRLKTDSTLLPELPPKTEQVAYCFLSPEQARLYAHEVESLRAVIQEPDPQTRLALVLPLLSRLKQICNHPAQYLGEQFYDPARSGKMQRLGHLVRAIAAAGESCLLFTQYRSIMPALQDFLASIFGSSGLVLHGGTPLAERQEMVACFQHPQGPPFFILSLKAAGTGLTLTRARHVIHFDRWWNPAVENQASDRAYRIGQRHPVLIHPLICRGTLEENIHHMLSRKRSMADSLLSGGLEKLLLRLSPQELLRLLG